MNEKILEINNLKITFNGLFQQVCAVDNITFDVKKSEIVALVGESGSGKSVTVKSIMGLLQQTQIDGEIFFEGQNILAMKEKELSKLRGRNISMIFQEPMSALNPVMKIRTQLEEILKINRKSKSKARLKIKQKLNRKVYLFKNLKTRIFQIVYKHFNRPFEQKTKLYRQKKYKK